MFGAQKVVFRCTNKPMIYEGSWKRESQENWRCLLDLLLIVASIMNKMRNILAF